MILALMVTLLVGRAAAIALGRPEGPGAEWQPFSRALSAAFMGLSGPGRAGLHTAMWWLHVVIVLGFLVYLPFSKHLRIVAATPNVYFRKLEPVGRLTKPNLEDESVETFGANQLASFSWRDVLDGYSCTECGRCTSVCPANATGKPLDPRKIITDLRAFALERGKSAAGKAGNGNEAAGEEPGIIGRYMDDSATSTGQAPAPLGDLICLNRLCVTQDGHPGGEILDHSRPLEVHVEYSILQPVRNLLLGFNVVSGAGVDLFRTYDMLACGLGERDPGSYESVFSLAGDALQPGSYLFEVVAGIHRQRWLSRGDVRLRLQMGGVRESDVDFPGAVAPLGDWAVRQHERA